MTSFEPGEPVEFDTDDDGFAETIVMDSDQDGVADAALYQDVETGDAIALIDSDFDGDVDTKLTDFGGDGVVDVSEEVPDGVTDEGEDDGELVEVDVVAADPFAVSDPIPEGVHGDPQAEIQFHQAQPGPVDCVPTSISMIATEITGTNVPAADVVAKAHEMNVLTESGMSPADGVQLLEEFGVDSDLRSGTTDQLRAALDDGQEIIIGLDATDLYAGGGGAGDPGMQSGHAVVITGIDDTTGTVYINDPGLPDGAGVQIPLAVFEDAWADSDNAMIVATVDGEGDGDGDDAHSMAEVLAVAAMILIPLTFLVRRLGPI